MINRRNQQICRLSGSVPMRETICWPKKYSVRASTDYCSPTHGRDGAEFCHCVIEFTILNYFQPNKDNSKPSTLKMQSADCQLINRLPPKISRRASASTTRASATINNVKYLWSNFRLIYLPATGHSEYTINWRCSLPRYVHSCRTHVQNVGVFPFHVRTREKKTTSAD